MFLFVFAVQAAEEAHNVFHPVTYEGVVDIDKESDPMKRCVCVLVSGACVFLLGLPFFRVT